MDWDDARVFLAVARTGQILAASKRLGVNHATVARRMDSLEAALRTKLLTRRTSGCSLTEAGERFLSHVERMETEMLQARSMLSEEDVALAGTVRIGAPDGFGVAFLAPALSQLTAPHPDLKIQLVPVPRSFSLSRREADIVVTVDRPDQGRLVARKLVDYRLGLYASHAYLARHAAPQTLMELSAHQLVGYVEDLVSSPSLDYAREILKDWQASFEISSALGQVEAVRAGAGIGILHTFIARRHAELIPILPQYHIERAYWLSYHETARPIRRIKVIADVIAQAAQAATAEFI